MHGFTVKCILLIYTSVYSGPLYYSKLYKIKARKNLQPPFPNNRPGPELTSKDKEVQGFLQMPPIPSKLSSSQLSKICLILAEFILYTIYSLSFLIDDNF